MASIINATTTNGVAVQGDNSGSLQLQTNNGTTAVTIDTSQNVGIGTSSPNTRVQSTVGSNGSGVVNALRLQNVGTSVGDGAKILFTAGTSTNGAGISSTGVALDSADLRFETGGSNERMRITSGGAVCINSTASSFNLRSSGVASAHFGDAYDASNTGTVQITRPANQGDNKFHLSFIRLDSKVAGIGFLNNSSTFAIQNADNNAGSGVTLTNGATSWGTTSDERKKDIIAPVENALSKLSDWRSVYYKYKTDKESDPQRVGLIAQDVQATLPEAVSAEEDEIQSLQLRYTETIPLLVAAIQELKAELDATKAEVQALKGVA